MNRLIFLLSLVCFTHLAEGRSGFVGNPDLPYPPGCAGDPGRTLVPFITEAPVLLRDVVRNQQLEVLLSGYRSTCSEPGRSLIWLYFDAGQHSQLNFRLELPTVRVSGADGVHHLMHLTTTPNGWGADSDPRRTRRFLENAPYYNTPTPPQVLTRWYLLDNVAPGTNVEHDPVSADDYNGPLSIQFFYAPDTVIATHQVPATSDHFATEPGIPLSGRLSGTWVIIGAKDQGISISISNRVSTDPSIYASREDLPLALFLAQYTYDAQGDLLWLTGSADFEQGSEQLTLDMVRVQGGRFMNDAAADREFVGTVRLVANSCDDITFEYDYSAIGLGTGSHRLQRLFSLETAGHECRDYAARVAANR